MFPAGRNPTPAGVYSYWLGGNDHYAEDRELAARVDDILGCARQMAASNRRYLAYVVRYMARRGITAFLDLGCGYPVTGSADDALRSTHEAARDENPDARVLYADADGEVCEYVSSVLAARVPGIGAAHADLADVPAVLGSEAALSLLGPGEPVGVIAGLSLHYLAPGAAAEAMAGYAARMAPGSMLAVTVPRYEDEALFRRVREACGHAEFGNFSSKEAEALFAGLDVLPPGVGPVAGCRPGWEARGGEPGAVYVAGGIGVKR